MAVVRKVVGLGRVARKAAGLRVRQPLAKMLVALSSAEERAALIKHQEHVLDELNVKALELLDSSASLLRYRVKPNLRLLGPKLGARLPAVRAALDTLDQPSAAQIARAVEQGEPVALAVGGQPIEFGPEDLLVETAGLAGYAVARDAGAQVALDTALNDELRREGLARDLVRAVQEVRKSAGLALADRVALSLALPPGARAGELRAALAEWGGYLQAETLAEELAMGEPPPGAFSQQIALDGVEVRVGVMRR